MRGQHKHKTTAACLLLLLITAVSSPGFAQEGVGGGFNFPGTFANCILQVTCDPEANLVNAATVQALLQSPTVIGQGIHDAFGFTSDDPKVTHFPQVMVESVGDATNPGTQMLQVNLHSIAEDLPADKLLLALVARLREGLRQLYREYEERVELQFADVQSLMQKNAHAIVQKRNEIARLTVQAGQSALSQQGQETLLLELYKQKQQLELEIRALGSRQKALHEKIALVGDKLEQAEKHDSLVEHLLRVVMLREEKVRLLMEQHERESDRNSIARVHEAEEQLALAHAELATRRANVRDQLEGQQLGQLQKNLIATEIEFAEAGARLEFVAEQIEKAASSISSHVQIMRLELETKEAALQNLVRREEEMRTSMRLSSGPTVSIIPRELDSADGGDKEEEPASVESPKSEDEEN